MTIWNGIQTVIKIHTDPAFFLNADPNPDQRAKSWRIQGDPIKKFIECYFNANLCIYEKLDTGVPSLYNLNLLCTVVLEG
jgi:hypothetical protein